MTAQMFKIFAPMLKASMGPDGKMRLHGIASSTVKDRHGDTMNPSALSDMERSANNNMTIFLNHEYRVPEDVAGSVERAIIRSHPQDSSIHDLALDIIVNQSNERAVKAWEAINGGTQLGLSIGAMIPENGAVRDRKTGSYEINHVDLLETSLVGVPANPRSWVEYAVKSLNGGVTKGEESLDEMIEEVREDQADLPLDETSSEEPGVEIPEEVVVASLDNFTTITSNSGEAAFTLVEPDIADATVSVETPFANITVDTGNRGGKSTPSDGTSQEALASAPENEETDEDESLPLNPWAAIGLSGEPEVEEVEPALQILEPTVVASLRTSSDLLKAITRELIDTKKSLDDALLERDAAVAATEKVLANTAEILARLSATPVGRRATVRQANEQFASLKSVYGDDFLTLLKKG
jgi:phage head maturation protease